MTKLQAGSDGLSHTAEAGSAGLVEGHDGLVSIGLQCGMDAEQLAGAVVVDAKDRGLLAIEQHGRGGIRPPHLVRNHGGDCAVVGPGTEDPPGLPGCLEAVLPHEEADAFDIGVDPAVTQAGVDFSVTLAHEGRVGEDFADGEKQVVVGYQGLGAALLERRRIPTVPPGVDRGTGNPQFVADGDEGRGTNQGSGHTPRGSLPLPGDERQFASPELNEAAARRGTVVQAGRSKKTASAEG